MWRMGVALGSLVFLGLVMWSVLVVSMRMQYEPVLGPIRRMNRRFLNPRAMKKAGQPGSYAAIHHAGRKSGRHYETPIGVIDTEEGFVVTLPYGTTPDWLKNVMAAGSAVIVNEGTTYRVDRPQIVPADDRYLPPKDRRVARLYGVRELLLLRCEE